MAAKHSIRYLPVAQDDLLSIVNHISQDSVERALDFVEKLDARISLLGQNPELGRIPRHARLREFGYRVLIIESYLVFYVIRGRVVEIHRVIHGSRNLDHLI
jgi:toxin ParE1/3/4